MNKKFSFWKNYVEVQEMLKTCIMALSMSRTSANKVQQYLFMQLQQPKGLLNQQYSVIEKNPKHLSS